MENEYLSLVDHANLDGFNDGKNYLALREIIRAAGSNYDGEAARQLELDYYLHNIQQVDPLKTFKDDWSVGLLSEAMFVLIQNNTKCEAILHYIVDHDNIKIHDDHIVEACKSYESIAFKLINKKGANVHHKKFYNSYSTLHTAAMAGFPNLVEYLLKCKVNPNALTDYCYNALHCACVNGNLDTIKLIIQTDVNLYMCETPFNRTPIGLAILVQNFDAASLILRSPIADDLKFHLVHEIFCNFCSYKLKNHHIDSTTDVTLFKLIWEKLVKTFCCFSIEGRSILSIYLYNTVFRSEKWFTGLKVILTSTIASTILEEDAQFNWKNTLPLIISKFDRAGVEKEHRMELLEILLSLSVRPTLQDLATTLFYFQCRDEFDLLSCHLEDGWSVENQMEYVASVFCGLQHQLNFRTFINLDDDVFKFITQHFTETNTKVPSLKELSRNLIRKLVIENTKVRLPKNFVKVVNSLRIPVKHKHFLMLKIPLNEF